MLKRQYLPRGKNPLQEEFYHSKIDRLLEASPILNSGNQRISGTSKIVFFDKDTVKSLLYQKQGDENGNTQKGERSFPSDKKFYLQKLADLNRQYTNHCRYQENKGRPKPTEWPKNLLRQKLQIEAYLYVLDSEISDLMRRLSEFENHSKEAQANKTAKYFCLGMTSLKNGIVDQVDGMPVRMNENRVLYIDCPQCKQFDGFALKDYLKYVVQPYRQAIELQAVRNREKALREGKPLSELTKSEKQGLNAPVPGFPEDCINYKKVEPIKA